MRFEKVSKEAFVKDCQKMLEPYLVACKKYGSMGCAREEYNKYYEECYDRIVLPERSTANSAGYDFRSPFDDIVIQHTTVFIPTGIRVFLDNDKLLQIAPRSSSSKKGIMLANTIGIIDSDYVNADNEGDIIIAVRDYNNYESVYPTIQKNEKIAQGVILPFYTVENDTATGDRTGGFGSTGK